MKKKNAFTLLELMVTLSIFSILSLMITAMLIQSQKILARADTGSAIQNEVRTALLKIQSEAKKYDEVVINNKFGIFNGDKWEIVEGNTSARELLRFSNDEEDIAKVYVEVNEDNKHQLVEFNINKITNTIIDNSKSVLISNIDGEDANSILVHLYESSKDNKLITVDCSSMITEDSINKTSYIASFSKNVDNDIDIDLPNDSSETDGDDGNDGNSGGSNVDEESDEDGWYENWQKDGIMITLNSENGGWSINIENKSNFDIFGWELLVKLDSGMIESYYNGKVENLGNNVYKIYSNDFYQAEIKKGGSKVLSGRYNGQMTGNINDITFRYKKVIESDNKYLELENGVGLKLSMTNHWDGTAQWRIDIKNTGNKTINKWELIFDFEKPINSVGWGLQFEYLGNGKYRIKNSEQNEIYINSEKSINFESGSGVLDRNLKNVEFNIIN